MMYTDKKDKQASYYRKVEAMYRKGYSTREIMNAFGLSEMEVLDTIQKIFALDMKAKQI